MQLPAFITAAVGYFQSTEAKLDAIGKAQTEAAELKARISTLTAERDTALADATAIKDSLEKEKAEHKANVSAQATEIANLKASVETEKRRANDVIAAQGLPIDDVPSSAPEARTGTPTKPKTITEQCIEVNRKKNLK